MGWRMANVLKEIRFQATVHRPADGGDWLFLRLPQEASDRLPSRSMVSVEGLLNGIGFQTTLRPDGEGGHWMQLDEALAHSMQVTPNSLADVAISPMATEPEPVIPDDLRAALEGHPDSLKTWLATTALARRDWIFWMTSGKKAETRGIRLEKMMDMLSKGKKRICCFDRSGMYDKSQSCPRAAE